jgi:hypothetical protein
MRMKHRWIAMMAVMVTLLLGACRPADAGDPADAGGADNSADPTTTISAEPSASSTPYTMDDY